MTEVSRGVEPVRTTDTYLLSTVGVPSVFGDHRGNPSSSNPVTKVR